MAHKKPIDIITSHPVLDEILTAHQDYIGKLFAGYRNHCFIVYNLVRHASDLDQEQDTALVIAAAFHDLSLWTDGSFDYLPPSIAIAKIYCQSTGRTEIAPLVEAMILYHHKVFTGKLKKMDPLIAAFRNADWSAVTFGLIPFDMFTRHRRAIASTFPDKGFHWFLVWRAIKHIFTGGLLNPLPMMKW